MSPAQKRSPALGESTPSSIASTPATELTILGPLGPEGGLACIAGIPDSSIVPDLPYSISIHDIGWEAFWARRLFAGDRKIWVE